MKKIIALCLLLISGYHLCFSMQKGFLVAERFIQEIEEKNEKQAEKNLVGEELEKAAVAGNLDLMKYLLHDEEELDAPLIGAKKNKKVTVAPDVLVATLKSAIVAGKFEIVEYLLPKVMKDCYTKKLVKDIVNLAISKNDNAIVALFLKKFFLSKSSLYAVLAYIGKVQDNTEKKSLENSVMVQLHKTMDQREDVVLNTILVDAAKHRLCDVFKTVLRHQFFSLQQQDINKINIQVTFFDSIFSTIGNVVKSVFVKDESLVGKMVLTEEDRIKKIQWIWASYKEVARVLQDKTFIKVLGKNNQSVTIKKFVKKYLNVNMLEKEYQNILRALESLSMFALSTDLFLLHLDVEEYITDYKKLNSK